MIDNKDVTDMLTTPEVMQMLRVGRNTLYRWRKLGIIKAYEFPRGRNRYLRSDVEKILREGVPA